tara:strand:- start:95 stop:1462 length:1368 start_codon:yes stop_codon:yes gene_type:complete
MGHNFDMRELGGQFISNIDMNMMEAQLVRGNQVVTGDHIYKIVSLYDYGLVKCKNHLEMRTHDLVGSADGNLAVDYDLDENNKVLMGGTIVAGDNIYTGTPLNANSKLSHSTGSITGDYFPLSKGTSVMGNWTEVKVLDGPMLVYGNNLSYPKTHISISSDFGFQKGNEITSGTTNNHGIQAWFDASDTSSLTLSGSDVTSWANKVEASQTFSQITASKKPHRTSVDLTAVGGSAASKAIEFNGTSQFLIANNNTTFLNTHMKPQNTYFTFIAVISGGADLDGTILSRTSWNTTGSGYQENQYKYEMGNNGSGVSKFHRTIGEVGASGTGSTADYDLASSAGIIVASSGYDTETGGFQDNVWINSSQGIVGTGGTYTYGNFINNAATTHMGAGIFDASGNPGEFFEGNLHEMIILSNRLSVGEFSDFGLNSTMVNTIVRYLNYKWFANQNAITIY